MTEKRTRRTFSEEQKKQLVELFNHGKVIPENTLKDCISDAFGSNYFADDFFTETVDFVVAEPCNTMRLILKDGTEKKITWQDRSRSESWTDEMREAVRQKILERNGAKK